MVLDPPYDAKAMGRDRLRHELKNPLAIILGRTHMFTRFLGAHPDLDEEERARLLLGVRSIEQQVRVLVARIDTVQSATFADVADG